MVSIVFCAAMVFSIMPGEDTFLAGWDAEQQGRYADALAAYQQAAVAGGELQRYAEIHVAKMHGKLGNLLEAEQHYRAVIAAAPEGPWTRMARGLLGRMLLDAGRAEEAVGLLREVTHVSPVPWWMENYAWATADAMLRVPGAQEEAYVFFRKIARDTIYVKPRTDAAMRLLNAPSPDDRALAIGALLRSGAVTDAGKALLTNTTALLVSQGKALPMNDLLELLAPKGGAEAATAAVLRQLAEALAGDWQRLWLAFVARSLGGGDRRAHAVTATTMLTERFPESAEAGDTLWWLGGKLAGQGDVSTALQLYALLAEKCPKHARADDAMFETARLLDASGTPELAQQARLKLADAFPSSRFVPEALYAAAAATLRAGDADGARAQFARAAGTRVGDFFAHRALDRLRQLGAPAMAHVENLRMDGQNPILCTFPLDVDPPKAWPVFLENNARVHRLLYFGRHGMDAGEWEALDLMLQLPNEMNPDIYYRVAAEAGFAHTALQFAVDRGWGMKDGKPTVQRLRLEFPRAYWPQVQAQARETAIDPYLILAVAKQESTFRAGIQSHAGATGVMQLMPGTASWLAKVDPNILPQHVSNLKSPENSIRLGAYYLSRMVERSENNLIYATASYNAGPGNNDKWRKRFSSFSVDEYVASIPYEETKGYVKKVLGNYAAYHTLYPAEAQVASATR